MRTVDPEDGFVMVPEGFYECEIAEARSRRSRDGSEQWSFRLQVTDGELAGRTAAWDSLTWSERGVYRVKNVLHALGIDVSGVVRMDCADLVGRWARVQIVHEDWEDPVTGNRQKRSVVPYLGYVASGGDAAQANGVHPASGDWSDDVSRTA